MKNRGQLSVIFLGLFALLWVMGPLTQFLFIVDMELHQSWGLSSANVFDPAFGWHQADELAIAYADMTYLVAGVIVFVGALMRRSWAIPFGFYTVGTWSFILLLATFRWPLLEARGFGVIEGGQEIMFYSYALVYMLSGWLGMVYLWKNRNIYGGTGD